MSEAPVRILIVEDSDDDAELAIRELRGTDMTVEAEVVQNREDLLQALSRDRWDLVIGDYTLPGFGGMHALEVVTAHDPDLPFIFVSGTIGEEKAVAAMRAGARDYVVKGNLRRLAPAVEREIREARARREQREAEREMREKDARLRRIVESNIMGIVFWSATGKITEANDAFLRMLRYSREDLERGRIDWARITAPGYEELPERVLREMETEGAATRFEKEYIRKDGTRIPVLTGGSVFDGARTAGVAFVLDISDRKTAEAEARQAAATVQAIVDASPIPIVSEDRAGRVRLWNTAAEKVFGWEADEVLGRPNPVVPPSERETTDSERQRVMREGERVVGRSVERLRKDGTTVSVRFSFGPTVGPDGEPDGIVGLLEDVTESKALEAQLLQAQKLEAVGRLAGGVAHDFNNLLTVILTATHFLLDELPSASQTLELAQEVQDAAAAAALLTNQLLAFSRKDVVEPQAVDVAEVVARIEKMIRRLIGEDIHLTVELASNLGPIRCDPGQLEQVLLNLAVNARDAMPEGGTLKVRTSAVHLDEEAAAEVELQPGDFIELVVRDSGTGIAPEDLPEVFEPFFTSKPTGMGTGLGLSTCKKIVRDAGGRIHVESTLGEGATFRVYLPTVDDDRGDRPRARDPDDEPRGTETILLVEDDPGVRSVASRVLGSLGYRVLEAENGATALRIMEDRGNAIELVLTDVVMPEMSGREVAEHAKSIDPDVKILFASGYTEDALLRRNVSTHDVRLLKKPFTPGSLARKVREVLDA